MRAFALKAFLFILLQAGIGYTLMRHYQPLHPTHYINAVSMKERILAETPSPKIVIIGGSASAFGPESDAISHAFGMPVVNMGLNAAMELDYTLNQVDEDLLDGDILLICPEPQASFGSNLQMSWFQIQLMLELEPHMIVDYSAGDLKEMSDFGYHYIRHVLTSSIDIMTGERQPRRVPGWPYDIASFDAQGDIERLGPKLIVVPEQNTLHFQYDPKKTLNAVRSINAHARQWESRGVTVMLAWPQMWEEVYERDPDDYAMLESYSNEHLQIPVILQLPESLLPSDLFWNTPFHLNQSGRAIRTPILIDAMRRELQSAPTASD